MTLPRTLRLVEVGDEMVVSSTLVPEFDMLEKRQYKIPEFQIQGQFDLSEEIEFQNATFEMDITLTATADFEIVLSNKLENELSVKYERANSRFIIDRSKTGDISFHPEFGALILAPRIAKTEQMNLKLVVDVASIELFADDGTTVMTAIFFPDEVLDNISFNSSRVIEVDSLVLKDII